MRLQISVTKSSKSVLIKYLSLPIVCVVIYAHIQLRIITYMIKSYLGYDLNDTGV